MLHIAHYTTVSLSLNPKPCVADLSNSFFVGDAAGREGVGGKGDDFADSDKCASLCSCSKASRSCSSEGDSNN